MTINIVVLRNLSRDYLNMKFVVSMLMVLLSGCTSLMNNGGGVETVAIDYPSIGIENTVYVGDEMLAKGSKTTVDAIDLKKITSVGLLGSYTFYPGIYMQVGHDGNKIFYSPKDLNMVKKSILADPYGGMYVDHRTKEICGVSVFGGTVCSNAEYDVVKYTSTEMLSFQQTLLYSGRVGSKINIGYREFSNNKARAAFSNDVEYDLNESNVIGYKGSLLEILNATNQSVTYKVIRNFK